MDLIGKTTIHPGYFYSGKISGYLTWVAILLISSLIYTLNILAVLFEIYSIVILHFIIPGEERFIENRFGSEYLNFKKKIRRYL